MVSGLSSNEFSQNLLNTHTCMTMDKKKKKEIASLFVDNIDKLVEQYQDFITRADVGDTSKPESYVMFWKLAVEQTGLETFAFVARCLHSIIPTSTFVERVFSLINNKFNDQQYWTLIDTIQLCCFSNFNPFLSMEGINGARDKLSELFQG